MSATSLSPELLCPAGSLQKLKYAFAFGADAVYAGFPIFSLRARENEFDLEALQEGMAFARARNKKVYLTVNIFARNVKIQKFWDSIPMIAKLKPDALIMSDPGLIAMVKERAPELPIHLSVQANCMNWQAVKFWQRMGIDRIILSRELKLNEIKTIHEKVPDIELEAFVHGSICIAYSGRCLMSHYMANRDANQGVCDNSCRFPGHVYKSSQPDSNEYHYYEDLRNPGEFYRIDEDDNGTYLMNSKDLCLVEYLKEIYDSGVVSFKIEGRTKSLHYSSVVTRAYRRAIEDMMAGRPLDPSVMADLNSLTTRGYTTGFMVTGSSHTSQAYNAGDLTGKKIFLGVVSPNETKAGIYPVEVKGQIRKGKRYQVISPNSTEEFTLDELYSGKGAPVDAVHSGSGFAEIGIPFKPNEFSLLRELV